MLFCLAIIPRGNNITKKSRAGPKTYFGTVNVICFDFSPGFGFDTTILSHKPGGLLLVSPSLLLPVICRLFAGYFGRLP